MEIFLVVVLQNDGNRFLGSKAKRFANFKPLFVFNLGDSTYSIIELQFSNALKSK
jgi:hypothetical protein